MGIIRVERELCEGLERLYGEDFGRCIFKGGAFIPYDPNAPSEPVIRPAVETAMPPVQLRRPVFDPVLEPVKWLPWRREKNAGDIIASSPPSVEPSPPVVRRANEIMPGDILVSVGLDWDHPYVDTFGILKETMGVQIICCCYDLIPILFPHYCVGHVGEIFLDYFTKVSWSASLLLCISRRSRDDYVDLVRRIGAPEVETVVIPLGDNVPMLADAAGDASEPLSPEVARVIEEPFILFVSTIERRKNHEILYRAYHLLARAGHAHKLPKLVFVGMPGWGVGDLLKDIELDPLTNGLIVQLHHVTDRELGQLYEKAYVCAFPSLYEGWGLPIGEALSCGKAVIASDQGSIPEVGGDLVTYLDPWNPHAWADEILALIGNPEGVKAREAAVRSRYIPRTWNDTAQVVKTALDRLRERPAPLITLYPGYDLRTQAGQPYAEQMHATGQPGILTYGPHHALPAGGYDIHIDVDKPAGSKGTVRFAICSDLGKVEHTALDVSFDETESLNSRLTIPLSLDKPVSDYEILSNIPANLLIAIKKIQIIAAASNIVAQP
ncbi:glycosyltransferase family 4 protein [Sphingobium sp. B10D3B]|uniref:glycosyltransferase family 4 protein n=1 Tax=Sphingobium sp. B10D3B TaxID=2940572 RepID=UPI001618190D|nr:glycosyltransferase family 1 protein [Sphingobium sp. B10D3B]